MTSRGRRLTGALLGGLAIALASGAPARASEEREAPPPASILLESLTIRVPEDRASAYDESIVREGPPSRAQAARKAIEVYVKEACPEPYQWRLEPPPLPGRRSRR